MTIETSLAHFIIISNHTHIFIIIYIYTYTKFYLIKYIVSLKVKRINDNYIKKYENK